MNYRASDIAQLPTYAPRPLNLPSKKDLLFCPLKSQKTEKKLLSTFNDLQLKLAEAKKMLTLSTEKPLCEFSF